MIVNIILCTVFARYFSCKRYYARLFCIACWHGSGNRFVNGTHGGNWWRRRRRRLWPIQLPNDSDDVTTRQHDVSTTPSDSCGALCNAIYYRMNTYIFVQCTREFVWAVHVASAVVSWFSPILFIKFENTNTQIDKNFCDFTNQLPIVANRCNRECVRSLSKCWTLSSLCRN